jgi:hypothetical protein
VDMMLETAPGVVSAGELTYLAEDAATPGRHCSCGAAYGACPRYGDWLATRPPGEAGRLRAIERRGNLGRLVTGTVPAEAGRAYRDHARGLFDHIGRTSGAEVVVDSSKSARDAAGRPLALSRLAGLDLRILHLTRDPRQTVRSYLDRGSNWVLEGHRRPRPFETWRPILGWTMANRIARRIGREIGADRYLHLRFEDLLADPAGALGRVATFAGIDLSGAMARAEAGEAFTAGHMVGGNRARLEAQTLRAGMTRTEPLPGGHALCLDLLGRGMAREFGYA